MSGNKHDAGSKSAPESRMNSLFSDDEVAAAAVPQREFTPVYKSMNNENVNKNINLSALDNLLTTQQLNFYNNLAEKQKNVLKAAVLVGEFANYMDLYRSYGSRFRLITQLDAKDVMEEAIKKNLFVPQYKTYNTVYRVTPQLALFLMPQLGNLDTFYKQIEKEQISGYHSLRNEPAIKIFVKALYKLVYDSPLYPEFENKYVLHATGNNALVSHYVQLVFSAAYRNVLHFIDKYIIKLVVFNKINFVINNLESLQQMRDELETLSKIIPESTSGVEKIAYTNSLLYGGKFKQILPEHPDTNTEHTFENAVAKFLYQNSPKDDLQNFTKAINLQKKNGLDQPYPRQSFDALLYFITLQNTVGEKHGDILKKMEKKLINQYDAAVNYLAAVYYITNDKEKLQALHPTLIIHLNTQEQPFLQLSTLVFCYFIDFKFNPSFLKELIGVVEKAFVNGYHAIAYEIAYALYTWYGEQPYFKQLYQKLHNILDYAPALSHLVRQPEWEKSLNALLGLGLSTAKTTSSKAASDSRVVYYVFPTQRLVQPVLQTMQKNGVWTKGRNIALKTFYEGKAKGMTEQDYRIAKTLDYHAGGYYENSYYSFSENIFWELAGHPYLFLDGTDDTPVEIIQSKPEVSVVKTRNGYALNTNIDKVNGNSGLILHKETNTRYKIFKINDLQSQALKIIQQSNIVVPETGKEKLLQLLGGFGAHLVVHSDLLATDSDEGVSAMRVVNTDTDSRIRVQLLPFGDGLKAELFSKPFGDKPPYTKPGKGGKVLITNEKGVQYQVKRDLPKETEYADRLVQDIQLLDEVDMSDELISFSNPLDSLNLLDVLANHTEICVVEWPEGERFKIRGRAEFNQLHLQVKSSQNWFELQGELRIDENLVVSLHQLLALTEKGHQRFIELKKGEFIALSEKLKKQLDELRNFSSQGKSDVKLNKFASVALDDFFGNAENLKADKAWREFRKRINDTKKQSIEIPATLTADLRPYQEDGYRWMCRLAAWEGGACLADDMGLGKTVQTLAVLLHRAAEGAALVVCPVSVVSNWIREAKRFAPTLRLHTLNGNRTETIEKLAAGDVLITSYGLLQSEETLLTRKEFATVVLDEAHIIKNFATKTSKATMKLQARFRVALTGTPLQNHLGEIWNLFNFINPGLLGGLAHFTENFIKPDNKTSRAHLKKIISPFILRRTKSAVLEELPPKTEIVKKVQLSTLEMAFYEALRRKAIETLENADGPKHIQALAEILRLRQASCNPQLVQPESAIGSSKMESFLQIVEELSENNHRALVFSQFVSHLSLVRKELDHRNIVYEYLDGSSTLAEREKSVKSFQTGNAPLFLISLKAGGLGLNLTAADYVIHLDPWWNPAVEDQASDRAHRIGQERPVTIYRLVAENTIEEKIIQLHDTKRDLAETLLEGSDQSAKLSLEELMELIRA